MHFKEHWFYFIMNSGDYIEDILGEKIANGKLFLDNERYSKFKISTDSGKEYFVKRDSVSRKFQCELNGIREIADAGVVRTPKVIFADENLILLEFIEHTTPGKGFFQKFGRTLGRLHRKENIHFGFYEDNFIGDTHQLNISVGSEKVNWADFYFNKRIMFQFRMCEEKKLASATMLKGLILAEKNIKRALETVDEKPALLHGDLWSGNFICDIENNPVLIDPAVYYGHREADLAMTKLFGGFHPDFYISYNEEYPLSQGWFEREAVYKLYHILNHLNLFGPSYLNEAESLINYYICRELN